MDRLVRQVIPILITLVVCLLVLLGYLFPNALLFEYHGQTTNARDILTEWAVILATFAFLLSLFNFGRVHVLKARQIQQGGIHSLALLLSAVLALAITVASGPSGDLTLLMFDAIISPVGASLAALLLFTLVLAAFRLLRTQRGGKTKAIVFILVVVATLLSSTPLLLPAPFSQLQDWITNTLAREWIADVFGIAGMRGLLLGIVLGTVLTALRFLWPRREL